MTSWIDEATTAFQSALDEIVGRHRPRHDPAQLGRAAALGAMAGSLWSDELGPFYDSDGVAVLLGGITKQAVSDRVRRHRLIALRTGSGRLVYPAFQFQGRAVVPGVAATLTIVAPDDTEAWYVASWFVTPDANLAGRSPIEALRNGDTDQVARAARDVAASLRS